MTPLVHYPYCNGCEKVAISFVEEPPGTFTTVCHGQTWITSFPPRTICGKGQGKSATRHRISPPQQGTI